jgi:phosphoribosylformylglycinamidine cyclo-ligase
LTGKKIIDGSRVKPGDRILGLSSSGPHSNGYSLIREVFNLNEMKLSEHIEAIGGKLGEELLKPTKIYVNDIKALTDKFDIKGISHITGGGFYENLPRMIGSDMGIAIYKDSWNIPPIFNIIKEYGDIDYKAYV